MAEELNFQGDGSDRLPPQNIEAEEAILGGILLDPEAIGRVSDRLVAEAFYISAHREIYQAALRLHAQGKPTDLLSITSWLTDNDLLARIGGRNKLATLVDRTVSAVNIDALAGLVMEKYLRRQLIKAGNEIVHLGYETETELPLVLDKAEQKVFGVTQERPQSGLVHISDTLVNTFQDIETRHQGIALPGIPCGFYDLDAMTSGFQRSDLIIVAGRPSMGKCLSFDSEIVLADGKITTIEQLYKQRQGSLLTLNDNWKFSFTQPSAFVDDGIKPVFRVTTRLGRTIETTITHPYLTIKGWQRLENLQVGERIAVPRKIDVFGTKTLRECEVKLLAYLIGDGGLTNSNPRFTNSNPLLQTEFSQAVADFGGLAVRWETSQEQCTPSLCVRGDLEFIASQRQLFAQRLKTLVQSQSLTARQLSCELDVSPSLLTIWQQGQCVPNANKFKKLCTLLKTEAEEFAPYGFTSISKTSRNSLTVWLEKLGLWGKDAHTKTVPTIVFQLERSQIAMFLNRLFATDGWATLLTSGQSQLGYCSVSEKLARQIQHLLLRFGIIARLKKRLVKYQDTRRQAWQLDITDAQSIKTFISEIGIVGKEAALEKVAEAISQKRYQTNCDLIPVEIWEQIAIAKGNESWASLAKRAGIQNYTNMRVGKRALKRERLWNLATALENLQLQQLATSDIYWDEIVAIELVGFKQVYDLTISKTHNFVANDICVHNTAFCLNLAHNIAAGYKLPVAVFSLEMSKEQLVQRLLASEAGIESGYLRSGRISQTQWEPLSRAIGMLSEMPIYIDDTPNMTVNEMRSQARRLQAEQGADLGLIVIDYLQLMEGAGDNRVQELSRITRSLKGLARELSVPVIALSQLSRGVEARTNKRPMLSDLRESGCLTGDTLITLADSGLQVPIKELVGKSGFAIWALNESTMQLEKANVSHTFSTGIKPVFTLTTRLGRKIRATVNHKFLTINGWKRLDELNLKQHLCLPRHIPSSGKPTMTYTEVALLGHLIGDGCTLPRHAIQYTTREIDLAENVAFLAREVFGDSIIPRISPERDWYQVYLSATKRLTHSVRNPIAKWLDSLGIFGLRSYEKFVPQELFSQPQELIACFLRHLWSTDGCIKLVAGKRPRPIAYYASSSERLAFDVQTLLLRLGINAKLKIIPQIGKGRNQYHVTITGKPDLELFIQKVRAVGEYKLGSLQQIAQHLENSIHNPNRDVIPKDVWKTLVIPAMPSVSLTTRLLHSSLGTSYCGSTLYKANLSRERALKVAKLVQSNELLSLANSDVYWDEIVSIELSGEEEVFDLTVPGLHNFVANNIIVHNSIEQDADLVIMLYRDEYYSPDTPDRGIAEVIVAKHRNGPTGTVKLLFDPQYTKFKNLARPNY
ncbi:replicative DNA helicase [Nostoc sp. PCC 7107]|uniref:replicative DNA helicase n=1 Tax=Nostoc sp. PCC 7107 TaxID=317936 RepID=UPI00029F4CA3|nr:replicative DNA helicase [Nostoc sp. PCC 7107]AFY44254.1 replicative DNA helicase [Nostoc sp. PCC 7107]